MVHLPAAVSTQPEVADRRGRRKLCPAALTMASLVVNARGFSYVVCRTARLKYGVPLSLELATLSFVVWMFYMESVCYLIPRGIRISLP
jgi:hypothetical protein